MRWRGRQAGVRREYDRDLWAMRGRKRKRDRRPSWLRVALDNLASSFVVEAELVPAGIRRREWR